ncbi:hypothetical protein J6590_017851 [Homalodisca vitripennis]|nr:hypothetical protein J6590_017851 [Homalodisca vitripennis]
MSYRKYFRDAAHSATLPPLKVTRSAKVLELYGPFLSKSLSHPDPTMVGLPYQSWQVFPMCIDKFLSIPI